MSVPPCPHFEVLIPCKPLAEGKSRLAPVMSGQERHELCAAMLRQTITIVMQIVRPEHIWLTTSDELAAAIVRECGVTVIPESGSDLNRALELARRHIQTRTGADMQGLMVLPIDLPLVDGAGSETLGCRRRRGRRRKQSGKDWDQSLVLDGRGGGQIPLQLRQEQLSATLRTGTPRPIHTQHYRRFGPRFRPR